MKNYGVTIYLINNDTVDLKEILKLIGDDGKNSTWKISGAECFGENAETLHKYSDESQKISGKEFYDLVSGIYQTLDGEFVAYKSNETTPWLSIRAIRGDEIDIETENKGLLNKFRGKFKDVKDLIY